MNENSNIPNQPDWEKLIAFLEQGNQDESVLTTEEQAQLTELKKIIASTGAALSSTSQFDSRAKWNKVKDRLIISGHIEDQREIEAETPVKKITIIQLWTRGLVAAAAVALIVIGIQFFKSDTQQKNNQTESYAAIKPGSNGASITLANGKVIQLSGNKTGVVVGKQLKYIDGTVVNAEGATSDKSGQEFSKGEKIQMLTARTAKGQTYEFILPDGTHAFLNADSKIIFPSQFIEKNRKILVNGEAYFEVVRDKQHPFIVETEYQKIEVLGTHFNVNSYPDEPTVKTTLLEGSVKVSSITRSKIETENKILKPSEQSQTSKAGKITVSEVDINKVVAWKNGKFIFDEESIETVMRKLSRWYNVEVIYEGDFSDTQFVGSISRSDNISKILDKITFTQAVKFKIEGRRIYVTK